MPLNFAFFVHYGIVVAAWMLAATWSVQAVTAAVGLRQLPLLLAPHVPATPTQPASLAVIIPACNEQLAIGACIQSLLDQDWPDLHLIAVDGRDVGLRERQEHGRYRRLIGRLPR